MSSALRGGGDTSKAGLFRTRVGSLIADLSGLYEPGKNHGHHSGGKKLHLDCQATHINPKDLYVGWIEQCRCYRCAEFEVWDMLRMPPLNRNRPTQCSQHKRSPVKECFKEIRPMHLNIVE
jgi:hypothetical protein